MSDIAVSSRYLTYAMLDMSDTTPSYPTAPTDSDTSGIPPTQCFPYYYIYSDRYAFPGMEGSFHQAVPMPVMEAGSELCAAERQPGSGISYAGQSQPGPSNVSLDQDRLSWWPGPDRLSGSSISYPSGDHGPSGRLPIPGSRSVEYTPKRGETARTTIPELTAVAIPPLPQPALLPLGLVEIPQDRYTNGKGSRTSSRLEDITFSVNNTLGFNMNDAFFKHFTGLDGRDDAVLENANGPVSCRLLFPGYPTRKFSQIAVKDWKKVRSSITRSKLAHEIAKRVKLLLDASATRPIAPSAHPRWTIGQGCMKLEKMYLVSFKWVAKGSLQPEIWVDDS